MTDEERLVPENFSEKKHRACLSLRVLCFLLGVVEVFGFAISLIFRSHLFNLLQHHIKHNDLKIRYAFESAQIFAGIRVGFEILQMMSGVCLSYGALKERYHLVAFNLLAIMTYAVLSPVMWWEILYFQNLHLLWIVPLWIGTLLLCWYFPYKLKNKLWENENHKRQEKLDADLGVEAI